VYENTLIIFTSDNGSHREGGGDPDFFNNNGIYRGYKRDLYEGGIRVPTIVSWQGKVPAGKKNDFAFAFWDYMPTFAELLKQPTPGNLDGVSVLPTILCSDGQQERAYLYFEFHEMNGKQAVIRGDWKLMHQNIRKKPVFELYNLASDPSENHNLVSLYPEIADEMKEIMKSARTEDPNWPLF
jgi:arylsulfatase A-like enzyme